MTREKPSLISGPWPLLAGAVPAATLLVLSLALDAGARSGSLLIATVAAYFLILAPCYYLSAGRIRRYGLVYFVLVPIGFTSCFLLQEAKMEDAAGMGMGVLFFFASIVFMLLVICFFLALLGLFVGVFAGVPVLTWRSIQGERLRSHLVARGYKWVTLKDAAYLYGKIGSRAFLLPEHIHVAQLPGYVDGDVKTLAGFAEYLPRR